MSKKINITLKVWRQKNAKEKGFFEMHDVKNVDTDASFLEMLDVVNETLTLEGMTLLLLIMIAVRVFAGLVVL